MPRFFENPKWQEVPVGEPPDEEATAGELATLLARQNDLVKLERRRRDIEFEAEHDCPYFDRLLLFSARPASLVLMQAMIQLGLVVAVHYKKRFMRPRPSQLEPRLRPMLDVPRHAAYPSGHSLQYHLVAKALASVVRSQEIGSELFAIAKNVAENREWAGLHYPSDTEAGKVIAFGIFPQVQEAYVETFAAAADEWR